MVKLVTAFQTSNVDDFEKVLGEYRDELVDGFIAEFVPALYVNVRTQLLLKLIVPYTTVRVEFLAKVHERLHYSLPSLTDASL